MSKTKTVVFSFDGTGNEPCDAGKFEHDESISNVLKMHILMGGGVGGDQSKTKTANGEEQVTFYYNGIGTRQDGEDIPLLGKALTWGRRWINQTVAPSWGDARRILNEAQRDWEEAVEQRDTIVVIGFSRGAALARKFAAKMLGRDTDSKIAFLGVFDTVEAMNGIHRRGEQIENAVLFENGTLNPRIERAVHILALDEDRVAFEPTLINRDRDKPERIKEIWFPGVHSDIGGGYWHDGLADGSLQYMIDEAVRALNGRIKIERGDQATVTRLIGQQEGLLKDLEPDDVVIHPSVKGIRHSHLHGTNKVMPKSPRRVEVQEEDKPCDDSEVRPLVHRSVKDRFDTVPEYRPPALRGVVFDLEGCSGEPVEVTGIAGLRETT